MRIRPSNWYGSGSDQQHPDLKPLSAALPRSPRGVGKLYITTYDMYDRSKQTSTLETEQMVVYVHIEYSTYQFSEESKVGLESMAPKKAWSQEG